mmetsp:Transcript_10668/g.18196  ORF Transcript_10668/g.18196 Transcript_10668/m.18196 type:complete len:1088 (-) Transcript_10668:69-3332(-)
MSSTNSTNEDYARQVTPLSCEREPIHIVNRIQPCGTLLVVDSELTIVQCSTNAVDLLPEGCEAQKNKATNEQLQLLDSIIGAPLSLLLQADAVDKVRAVVRGASASSASMSPSKNTSNSGSNGTGGTDNNGSKSSTNAGAVRTFLIRTQGALSIHGRKSCGITQSGEHFLLEIEDSDLDNTHNNEVGSTTTTGSVDSTNNTSAQQQQQQREEADTAEGEEDTMLFMQSIAHDLRKCWSIEEMAGLVCSRIMSETPYDRGMVYRFDASDDSGEVIYETTRWDARRCCRDDSFLGLRFPASDIPRQARELFMKNTLRFVYDVQGTDHALYPRKIRANNMGGESEKYTDLSMCRLRGSSYIHLDYLRNMKVTSSLVIAIIVNKRLWGLYSFHGYRHPIRPSARTRFLCEMASVMTSMVMESLTRANNQSRLMDIDQTLSNLQQLNLVQYMSNSNHRKLLMERMEVNLIAFRQIDADGVAHIHTFCDDDSEKVEISAAAFDCLNDTYGQVCRDYGVVFVDETRSNKALGSLHTLAFFQLPGMGLMSLDVVLSRKAVVEVVQWGGDPDKSLESDGTLSPRSSFASFMKGHLKKGKPWDDDDKQRVRRFAEKVEKYTSTEVVAQQNVAIQNLGQEKKDLIQDQKENLEFFAFMAHEMRTPFHGVLGSLEAMREDSTLVNNALLNQAYMCGKNMLRILDDILLVAKGSHSLTIKEETVNVSEFLRQTVADMTNFAYMEGVSVRVRKEDVKHQLLVSDFNRIRQVVHNLISNAIKFSEKEDIYVECLQRETFSEVLTVWKTYAASYPNHEPKLKNIASETANAINPLEDSKDSCWIILSVIDRGIGIKAADLKLLGTAFTQLSQGRQKKYQGTGLGITISNMIMAALGGTLVAFSAPEYGSCFTFAIPVKRGRTIVEDTKVENKAATKLRIEQLQNEFEGFGFGEGGTRKRPRVLVVDDSTINRKICSRKIKKLLPGVEITECASGKSCIQEYEHDYQNIMGIFLDFHMPGMDGDVVARNIREFEQTHEDVDVGQGGVWIVGYTADILDETKNVLLDAGMNRVLPKPEPMHAFQTELRTMMQRAAANASVNETEL